MIFKFFKFLKQNRISFCITNGYEDIINGIDTQSDIDILFKKSDFLMIEKSIQKFSKEENIQLVQILHHDLFAKNIFLYNPKDQTFLNLDIYGELSRNNIVFFDEKDIFSTIKDYQNIPILSAEKEFVYYLIKKIDKTNITKSNFLHLRSLYLRKEETINKYLKNYFKYHFEIIIESFKEDKIDKIIKNILILKKDFYKTISNESNRFKNLIRTIKRIFNPTGITISFLGPDGSGKSTIIDKLLENRLPFRRKDYFHLKPILKKQSSNDNEMITDPHKYEPYNKLKSYLKLLYFIYQYNQGWIKNISKLKIKSSLIIFDRYFDDLIVDNKRYRYGGSKHIAKLARLFIPKPDIYFILTSDAEIIYKRKQEVPFEELERQVKEYKSLADNKRYFNINVDNTPEEIVKQVTKIIMDKMNERY